MCKVLFILMYHMKRYQWKFQLGQRAEKIVELSVVILLRSLDFLAKTSFMVVEVVRCRHLANNIINSI